MGVPLSVSFRTSSKSTSISHNNRTISEEKKFDKYHDHIDWSKTNENIILVKKNIEQIYGEIFSDEVEKYNAKQKRADRKIDNYFLKVKKDKSLDLQREFIIQVGDKKFLESGSEETQKQNRKIFSDMLVKYTNWFQEKYPELKIYNATIHMDEATPHLHMNVVPVANGYKQGMKKRPSFSKFLKNNDLDFKKFRDEQMNEIESIMKKYGAERKLVGTHEYEKPSQYRETIREAEEKSKQIISDGRKKALETFSEAKEDALEEVAEELSEAVEEIQNHFDIKDEEFSHLMEYANLILDTEGELIVKKFSPIAFVKNLMKDIKEFFKNKYEQIKFKENELDKREKLLEKKEEELKKQGKQLEKKENLFVDLNSEMTTYKKQFVAHLEPLILERFPDNEQTRKALDYWKNEASLDNVLSAFNTNILGKTVDINSDELKEVVQNILESDKALYWYDEFPDAETNFLGGREIQRLGFYSSKKNKIWTRSAIESYREKQIAKRDEIAEDKSLFVSKLKEIATLHDNRVVEMEEMDNHIEKGRSR